MLITKIMIISLVVIERTSTVHSAFKLECLTFIRSYVYYSKSITQKMLHWKFDPKKVTLKAQPQKCHRRYSSFMFLWSRFRNQVLSFCSNDLFLNLDRLEHKLSGESEDNKSLSSAASNPSATSAQCTNNSESSSPTSINGTSAYHRSLFFVVLYQ